MQYVALAWLVVGLGACGGQPAQPLQSPGERPRDPARDPARDPTALELPDPAATAPVTFAPPGAAVARYNDPPLPVPATPYGDAVTAATREEALRAGLSVPRADARLFRACADLAELVPEASRDDVALDSEAIEFALQRNGIIEPEIRLLFGWAEAGAPGKFVAELRPKLGELLRDSHAERFGVGLAQRRPDGATAVVFALQSSWISTAPIRRAVPARGEIAIDAVLDPHYREPEVFVTRDDGRTRQLEVSPGRPRGFLAQLACDDRDGRQQIEIAASDATGATVLANFPVWCGAEPPAAITYRPEQDVPVARPDQAERYLLASVNRDREAAGLTSLAWHEAIAAVAREHSDEMRTTRAISHISPTTGTVVDRVRAARIPTRILLENVARGFGLLEAHRALMNSPGHRANLMSDEVNQIGIGVVFGDEVAGRRELYITEIFLRGVPATARP